MFRRRLIPLVLLAVACQTADRPSASDPAGLNTDPIPAEALAAIDTATLMQHVRVLAADSLLGRQPGTVGEDRTAAYLESQFKALGLDLAIRMAPTCRRCRWWALR